MNYIVKHWKGNLSLSISFWVNIVGVNLLSRILLGWLMESSPIEHPVTASQLTVLFYFVLFFLIYPWQGVGLWRSADKYFNRTGKIFWPAIVKLLLIIGIMGTIANTITSWPVYKLYLKTGFGTDEYGDYQVELVDDGSLIHLKGGLGFGVSDQVETFLKDNPEVSGIILDSFGGRIYEGRRLSEIIFENDLDTFSFKGCYSSCVTAFISGRKRYLGLGANLAFHKYQVGSENNDPMADMLIDEQEKDLEIFMRQGVNLEFIDRIFKAGQDEFWYPTIDELLSANVIHEVVNPSDFVEFDYENIEEDEVEKELLTIPVFQSIKRYDPVTYNHVILYFKEQMRKGASPIEIQVSIGKIIGELVSRYLPKTSNEALIEFARAVINRASRLKNIDSFLCMKYLYPDYYGPLEYAKYSNLGDVNEAINRVIIDSYEKNYTPIELDKVRIDMENIMTQLGEDIYYLQAQGLESREDYAKACNAAIKLYESILSRDSEKAGSILRYMFTEEE